MSDQKDFTGTMPVQEKHQFDAAAVESYLAKNVEGFAGPLTVEQFKGGQSNPTYKLITPTKKYVLRRKPPGKLLASAHAVDREYKVITALAQTDVPVARTYVLCEDDSIIGTPFYVMDCVEGRIMWDPSLPDSTPEQRRAIFQEMNRVMAALHKVDYQAVGLGDYGKPGNYFARQIDRWSKQYRASETEKIEAFDQLIEWLPANIPAGDETSVVHGDYRLDNTMFHASDSRIIAVLDWELSTLGHPLADFSYHCMAWHISPGTFRGIGGLDVKALGIPTEDEYIRMYCDQTGITTPTDLKADWNFYLAYNMFRMAAILQGIAKRVEMGTASSAQAISSGAGARPMAEMAWKFAQQA